MGCPILIGQYYSLILIGVIIDFLYPIYYLYFSAKARNSKIETTLKQPIQFIVFTIVSTLRFGLYSFLLLTALAIIAGILFSLWAILSSIGT